MTTPLIEAIAHGIRFAENPLDGDPFGVMIHNYEFLEADTIDEQIAEVDATCRAIAQAALTAIKEAGFSIVASRDLEITNRALIENMFQPLNAESAA